MTNETQSTALIEKEPKAISSKVPKQFTPEFLKNKFTEVEKEVNAEVFDLKTEDGRKRIKEVAAGINKSRDSLDTPIRNYLRAIKAQPKVIEADARESKLRFEKLREGVIGPLNEARKYQDDLLDWLNGIPTVCSDPGATSEQIQGWLDETNNIDQSTIWPELKRRFVTAHEAAITTAKVTLERVEKQEQQEAELARLKAESERREQEDSERKIREEAANQARLEAEEKAKRDQEILERRAAEAKHREEQAAIREEQAKQAVIDSEKSRIAEIERSKVREAEALKQSEEKLRLASEEAIEAEKRRAIEAEKEQEKIAKARAEDKELRIKVNRANLVVLIAAGFSEDEGKKLIKMIARGELPDIKIYY